MLLAGRKRIELRVTTASYTHDASVNRTQTVYPQASQTIAGTYDAQDRLLSYGSTTYAYTGNGELKLKVVGTDSTKYRYDAFGNLRTVNLPGGDSIEYVIDAQQRRIGRKYNGALTNRWLYQSQLAIAAEVDGSGNLLKEVHLRHARQRAGLDARERQRVPHHHRPPGQRAARGRRERHRGAADRLRDAYGRVLTNTNPGFQPFGYAGGILDDATGLTRFGARDYYDAEVGRWYSNDPLGVEGGLNQFEFAAGSPVTFSDPGGLCPQDCNSLNSQRNARLIGTLRREFQPLARRFVAAMDSAGHPVFISEGYRSYERSDAIVRSGVRPAQPGGYSYHNFGLAFDAYPFVNCRARFQDAAPGDMARMGDFASRLGLEWGGNYRRQLDPPHFQMSAAPPLEVLRELNAGGRWRIP